MKKHLPTSFDGQRIVTLFFFRRHIRLISMLALLAFLNQITGCRNYYEVTTYEQPDPDYALVLEHLRSPYRLLFAHFGRELWEIRNYAIFDNKEELFLVLAEVPADRQAMLYPQKNRGNRYKRSERHLVRTAHIYFHEDTKRDTLGVVIPIASIQKIEMYAPDVTATFFSWLLGVPLAALGAATIFWIYLFLFFSLEYTHNGEPELPR